MEFTTIHTNVKIISEVDSNYFKIVKNSEEVSSSQKKSYIRQHLEWLFTWEE